MLRTTSGATGAQTGFNRLFLRRAGRLFRLGVTGPFAWRVAGVCALSGVAGVVMFLVSLSAAPFVAAVLKARAGRVRECIRARGPRSRVHNCVVVGWLG